MRFGAAEREHGVEIAGAEAGEVGCDDARQALLGGAAERERLVFQRAVQGRQIGGIGGGAHIHHGGEEFRRVPGNPQGGLERQLAAGDGAGENGDTGAAGQIDGRIGGEAGEQEEFG